MTDEPTEEDTYEEVSGYASVLTGFTDEQLDDVKKLSGSLVSDDSEMNKICTVLIAARQIYAQARLALQGELTKEGYKWEDGVEEFLLKSMSNQADQPFQRDNVLNVTQSTVLGFLIDDLAAEAEAEATENMRLEQEEEAKARIPVPWPNVEPINRGEALIVVADKIESIAESFEQGVSELQQAADSVGQDLTCLRLKDKPSYDAMQHTDELIHRIGSNHWADVISQPAKFNRLLENSKKHLKKGRCDVLVVDDLLRGGTSTFGSNPLWQIESNIKRLRKWAIKNHAALVGWALCPEDECMDEFKASLESKLGSHVRLLFLAGESK